MLITCPKCSVKYKIPPEIKLSEGKKIQCSACGHIFEFHLKQEESPAPKSSLLPPEDAVLSFDSTVKTITLKTTEAASPETRPVLPEAFRPLQGETKKTACVLPSFWCIVSVLLLVGLILMGWLWRDLLLMKNQNFPSVHTSLPMRVHKRPSLKPVSQKVPDIPLFVAEDEVRQPETPSTFLPSPQLSVQSVRFRKTPTGEAILIEGVLKNTTSETVPVPEKIYALAYDAKGALAFEKEIYLPSGVLYPDMEQPFFGTYTSAKEEIQWVDVVLKK